MFSSFGICANLFLDVLLPSPNCPFLLFPVPHTVPLSLSAITKSFPTLMSLYVDIIFVLLGMSLLKLFPSPSLPSLFSPNVHILPSAFTTAAKFSPATTFGA